MRYLFDSSQLEAIKWCIDNHSVQDAFRVVNHLEPDDTVPVEDVVDFNQQFRTQYTQIFGCG